MHIPDFITYNSLDISLHRDVVQETTVHAVNAVVPAR